MTAKRRKTLTMEEGDKVFRATFSQSETVSIDEAGLKKGIGAANWAKIVKTVVDRTKLREAIDTGVLSPEQVGVYMQSKKSAPSIRFTEGVRKEEVSSPDEGE
jgi:hypothetical protein